MAEAGIFGPDERVELLDGGIFPMLPNGPFHGSAVMYLTECFNALSQKRWHCNPQNALELSSNSVPQPDIALLRRRKDRYSRSLPKADDVYLVVEVPDTSLVLDRRAKLHCTQQQESRRCGSSMCRSD